MELEQLLEALRYANSLHLKELVVAIPIDVKRNLEEYIYKKDLYAGSVTYNSFPLRSDDSRAMAHFEAVMGEPDNDQNYRRVHALDMGFSSVMLFGVTLHYTTINHLCTNLIK